VKYYILKDKDKVEALKNKATIIDKIRSSRLTFIESELPKAIAYIAKNAFQDKLALIRKQQYLLANKEYNTKKRCLNHACKGILGSKDDYDICDVCREMFCKKCELRYRDGHVCDNNVLETLSYISSMVHCPGCNKVVEKSEGCDHMKCLYCGVKFNYSSRQLEDEGYHTTTNKQIGTEGKSLVFLVRDYIEKSEKADELTDILSSFEYRAPTIPSINRILSAVKDYENGVQNTDGALVVIKSYEKYKIGLKRYRKYVNIYNEIVMNISKLSFDNIKQLCSQM
jgi:hypothetical protein